MNYTINPARQGGELQALLPRPQKIFFADPYAPPIEGFLILRDQAWRKLEDLLERYILEHTLFVVQKSKRDTREPEKLLHSRTLFFKVVEEFFANASVFDQGQGFPEIFLLGLLRTWEKVLPDIPQLASSVEPSLSLEEGVRIQLRIFSLLHGEVAGYIPKGNSRASQLWTFFQNCPDWVLEKEREEPVPVPWPFGEVYYGVDAIKLKKWYDDACLAAQVAFSAPRQRAILPLLFDREQATFAQILCAQQLLPLLPLPDSYLPQWKKIALGLVYGDLFRDAVRRLQFCRREGSGIFLERGDEKLLLHEENRPLQFSLPGVVNFRVKRFCLRYDLQGFSSKVEQMGHQDEVRYRLTLEQIETFQRDVLTLCRENGLIFEKYLSNGGLLSTRHPLRVLKAALALQKMYRRLCGKGFFFSDGLRIALHYASYSMLPVLQGGKGYGVEFYGRGMVELEALMNETPPPGRAAVEQYLRRQGMEEAKVRELLDPLPRSAHFVDTRLAAREFYCTLTPSGHLFNRGIVATLPFVDALGGLIATGRVFRTSWDDLPYLGVALEDGEAAFGMRLLGVSSLPRLEDVELVEISPEPPDAPRDILNPDIVGSNITQVLRTLQGEVPPAGSGATHPSKTAPGIPSPETGE